MSEPINSTISPWMPMQDQHQLAMLGKLAEEAAELASRASRCIIQGIDELDPDTGRSNRDELAREIADVLACVEIAHWYGVTPDGKRQRDKVNGFDRWHNLIDGRAV